MNQKNTIKKKKSILTYTNIIIINQNDNNFLNINSIIKK